MTGSASGGRPLAFTPDEAAELLRVSPSLIRSLVRTGALPRVAGLGRAVMRAVAAETTGEAGDYSFVLATREPFLT
jgi:excisionase family DNA binding protein